MHSEDGKISQTTVLSYESETLKESLRNTAPVFRNTQWISLLSLIMFIVSSIFLILFLLKYYGLDEFDKILKGNSCRIAIILSCIAVVLMLFAIVYFALALPDGLKKDSTGRQGEITTFSGHDTYKSEYYEYERWWGPKSGWYLSIISPVLLGIAGFIAYLYSDLRKAIIERAEAVPAKPVRAPAKGGYEKVPVEAKPAYAAHELRKTAVAAAILCILVVVSLVLVFNYLHPFTTKQASKEPGQQEQTLQTFLVSWRIYDGKPISFDDSLFEGEARTFDVTIDEFNVTKVKFKLSWEDDETTLTAYDTFRMVIYYPDGSKFYDEESNAGEMVIETPAHGLPGGFCIYAENRTEAEKKLREQCPPTRTSYSGVWKVEITLVDCGNLAGLLPIDTGNDCYLEVNYQYYKPAITQIK